MAFINDIQKVSKEAFSKTVPSTAMPNTPIPPGVGRLVPPRTITSLVPGRVRDTIRFAEILKGRIPARFGGTSDLLPPSNGPQFAGGTPQNVWTGDGKGVGIAQGYLSDHIVGNSDLMYFQYNPEEVEIEPTSGWVITELPGRSHPFIQWGGGGQKKIRFTLRFYHTMNERGNVADNVNWLHKFMLPAAFNNTTHLVEGPHPLDLYLGGMLARGSVNDAMTVLMIRASCVYKETMRPENLMPLYAEVRLEFLALMRPGKTIETADDNYNPNTLFKNIETDARRLRRAGELDAITPRDTVTIRGSSNRGNLTQSMG